MISNIVSRLVILVFGTLYPAYASYKAVRTKNVKEYVKWMMYWIVYALFTCAETFTDVFLSFWFPFYYEIKIILVLWLLSPATKGSSILYRKFVHPMLSRREQEIDEYIAKAKEQGYHTVLHLGTKGVNYATNVIMQTAIRGGGGLVQQLRRSYSLSDLSSDKDSMSDVNRNSKALSNIPDDDMEETDGTTDPRLLRARGYSPRRSASGSGRVEMYFPEVDVDVRQHGSRPREPSIPLSHIRSSEDVSSGYSSAEPLYAGHHPTKAESLAASREPLVRTASMGSTRSMRTKSSRGGIVTKRPPVAEDSEPWVGDEAEFQNQEENFFSVSSSQPSQSAPIPIQTAQPELFLLLQQLNAASPTNIFTIETQSYEELSTSNLNPVESIDNRDLPGENDIEDSEFYVDVIDSFVDSNVLTQESPGSKPFPAMKVINPADTTEVSDETFQEADSESFFDSTVGALVELPQTSLEQEGKLTSSTEDIPITHPNSTQETVQVESSRHSIGNTLASNENDFFSHQKEHILSTTVENVEVQCSNNLPSVNLLLETFQANNETFLDPVMKLQFISNKEQVDNSTKPILHSDCSTEVSETSDTTLIINNTLDTDKMAVTFSELEGDFTLNDIETSEELKTDDDLADISRNSDETIVSSYTNTLENETVSEQPATTVDSSEYIHTISLDEATADSPISHESLESLISDRAQVAFDRKDARSGRYHKRPAPCPPAKATDSEICQDCTEDGKVTLDATEPNDAAPAQLTDDQDMSNTQTAVKARLVLKPGIVRALGPEPQDSSHSKSEKFVSTSPKTKQKNTRSHTPGKYRESSFSRLLLMPKNQLGHFASLFPFWHSRGERSSPTSQSTHAGSFPSLDSEAIDPTTKLTEASHSSARIAPAECGSMPHPPVVPVHSRIAPMSSCSLEYLPFVGSVTDYIVQQKSKKTVSSYSSSAVGSISRMKSNSISDFKIREMSHSPPLTRHQAPEN